jgi:5-deoxy-glucuronate isomerase
MEKFFKYRKKSGYSEVVGDASELELIRFGLIWLESGEAIDLTSGEYELGLVLLSGQCDIACEGEKFTNHIRKDVFSAKPVTVYIPRDAKYEVKNAGPGPLEIAVCKVKADQKLKPFLIQPEETITNHRGRLNWNRDVVDIFTHNVAGRVDRILVGETFACPGQWSSYPSHKHDRDNPPQEVWMEEVYHFKVDPPQGFGIQVLYTDDLSLDESYTVRNGDTIAIARGYHPVAAAPGYQVYYLWVMAGRSGRALTPNDDPNHAWLKAVERML